MPQIETVGRQLTDSLKQHKADYIEARLEESRSSSISYRGRELETVSRASATGGNVRALVNGGWGFASFNSLDGISGKIKMAVAQARLAGAEKSLLAEVAPVEAIVPVKLERDPVAIPLAEKKALLEEYNELIWQTPGLKTSVIGYGDSHKKTVFVSSTGSYIVQERA
ncbi:MAG: TldD/PmbA family protein, partial [Dehalococcoidales bacterium]|nr:TldD/PmbA family protein [Dehalococcoidales bacterium]